MSDDPLHPAASAAAIAAAIASGAVSAREVTQAAGKRIAASVERLNAFTQVTLERALEDADAVDRSVAAGAPVGALAGVPFAVKNLFDIEGVVTLAGSRILASNPPAARDASAVAALRRSDAILCGALNMDEFAFGFTTENSHYGPTRNPHERSRVAGGSSGGSAAAVTAGLVPLALGSDTNGSVRVPASFCGSFALKPTYGRISRTGVQLFSTSLDHVGLFARSVEDLCLAFNQLQSRDSEDAKQADRAPLAVSASPPPGGLRIARLGGLFESFADERARAAVQMAADALDAREVVDAPLAAAARAAGAIITYAEAGNLHRERIRERREELDPVIRHRLVACAFTPAEWYLQAQRVRAAWVRQLNELFEKADILLAPATPWSATPIGTETVRIHGQELPARPAAGLMTQPLTPAGVPIAVAPLWPDDGLPLGVQLIAPAWREDLALQAAWQLEQSGLARAPVAPEFGAG